MDRKGSLDRRARDDLDAILGASPHVDVEPAGVSRAGAPRAASWARRAVPIGALTVLVAATLVGGGVVTGRLSPPWMGSDVAFAATPTPLDYVPVAGIEDTSLLNDIAGRVDNLPDDIGSGPFSYVALQSWHLWTRIDGEQVTSEVIPERRRTWLGIDGSGRIVSAFGNDGAEHTETFGPGQLTPMWPMGSLSADEAELADQLAVGHPATNGPAERLVAIQDAYRQMPLPPQVRAAILRYLADTPGLAFAGRVTDRVGRQGVAFSVDSDYSGLPTRYTVIIDPDDGRLLGAEEMLTTTAGALNVRIPSVIGYTTYLEAFYTDSME